MRNYQFSSLIQTYILYSKGNTDRWDIRIENTWEAELLVLRDSISHRLVQLVLVVDCAVLTAGEHVDHSESKRLSHNENVSQNYMIADEMSSHQL